MGSDKTQYRLSNVIDIIGGGTPRRSVGEFWGGDIPWLSVVDFNSDARFVSNTVDKITELGLTKSSTKLLPKGALIISARGTVGCLAQLQKPMAFNQSCYGLKAKADILEDDYLYYLVKYKVSDLQKRTHGSVFDTITRDTFEQIIVDIPDNKNERVAISKTLGDLDKKIEINNQTNQTLEQMAQALFKSWFVDFDPVFDNLLASADFNLENLETSLPDELKQKAQRRLAALNSLHNAAECKVSLIALAHEFQAQTQAAEQVSEKAAETPVKPDFSANPNILAQHANTHAHFPNEFEHNEQLGWIPKGWEVCALGDKVTVKRGGSPRPIKDYIVSDGLPWTKISDATASTSRFIKNTKEYIKPEGLKKTTLLKKGTLILSNSATPGLPKFLDLDACIHDGWLHFPIKETFSDLYLYQLFLVVRKELVQQGNGSVFTNLKTDILKNHNVVVPSELVLQRFDEFIRPHVNKIHSLSAITLSLEKLRDILLPKLISGELQIPDVATDEEIVD